MSEANVFSAISDPTRRAMLDLLSNGSLTAGEIVSHFSHITQPGISRHLRVLREARLVSVSINAQQRVYALNPEGLLELHQWISRYQKFWGNKLDALEDYLNNSAFKKIVGDKL